MTQSFLNSSPNSILGYGIACLSAPLTFLRQKLINIIPDYQIEWNNQVQFSDVIGIDEFKEELLQIVSIIKKRSIYKKYGAEIPKGIILHGPPGTGKTLLVKALANQSGLNIIHKSGSDFQSKYYNQGAQNVKETF